MNTSKKTRAILVVLVVIIIGFVIFKLNNNTVAGDLNVSVDKKFDGSTTVKSDYGTATYGGNKLPDNWPSDAPIYPNSTVTFSGATNVQAGTVARQLMLATSDSNQQIIDFYKSKLTSLGWVSMLPGKEISAIAAGPATSISGKKGSVFISITISSAGDGKSNVTMMTTSTSGVKVQ
jgi:hypothetical protein